jgi:hypothetical protein
VWRRKGEYEEGIVGETDKYPRISIRSWVAIGIDFKSRLSIFEETVNSDVDVEALESSGFLRMADERFGERQWHFVEDGQAVTRVHRLWTLFLKSVTFSVMAAQFA